MKKIYLDYAATSPVDPKVFQVMKPYFSKNYGNASEQHQLGVQTKKAIEESRKKIAHFLGAHPQEIIFTCSATESINLALKGLVEAEHLGMIPSGDKKKSGLTRRRGRLPHLITSLIEHKAVLATSQHLERAKQAEVSYLSVTEKGLIKLSDLKKAVQENTLLVSLIYVNNEVGTIQPIAEVGRLIKKINLAREKKHLPRIFFHTDATQAVQYLPAKVDYLGVDLLSLTGHKFYAPKGIGLLYLREGTPLIRQMDGGSQEFGLRGGTENTPFIVGLGRAIELISQNQKEKRLKVEKLRDYLIEQVLKIPGIYLTGDREKRAPHIASFTIEGVEGEALVLYLSEKGIMVSSGSACTSQRLKPSHVLTAMGLKPEDSHGSLRFSLSGQTTKAEIDQAVDQLNQVVKKLRLMAPEF